ncbi:MAG: oligosaccharide flippase family protein [Acidobacteria bacterium]|nr:oligosaccharide flippase family protein [Acidobacteriota bacterium]
MSQAETTNETQRGASLTARASWLLVAKCLSFAFSFALPLLLVRRLSQAEYGLYKQVFLVVGTALGLLPLGFGLSTYYFLPRAESREERARVVFNVLLFNLCAGGLGALALVLFPGLLGAVFNEPELRALSPLIGAVVLFWVFAAFLETVAVANQETYLATLFIIGANLTKAGSMLAAAVAFGTVRSLVYAALVHSVVQTVVLLAYLARRFPVFWRGWDWPKMREQLSYALPFGAAGLLFIAQTDLHSYFVSHQFGPSAFAVYAIGCFDLPLIGILAESVTSVMIPRVSLLQKQGARREILLLTTRVIRKLAFVYFPIYAFLMVAGREFIALLFTERYLESWPVFAVNLTIVPVAAIMFDPIVRAYAAERYFLLRLRIMLSALMLAVFWFWTARLGLIGMIAVVVAVGLVERLAISYRAAKVVGFTARDFPLLADVGKLALAAALAAGGAAVTRAAVLGMRPFWVLAACGSAFVLVYGAAVLLLGVPSADERDSARRLLAPWRRRVQRDGAAAGAGL